MKTKFKISLLLFTLFLSVSCEDYLAEEPPLFISASNFWTTESDARTGVDGIYKSVSSMHMRWMGFVDAFTDDVVSRTAGHVHSNPFGLHTINPGGFVFNYVSSLDDDNVYFCIWQGISRANTALKFIPNIDMDETQKSILIGEARALRAFFYYKLVKLWGDAPMITEGIETEEDFNKPRTDVNIIYDEVIIPDLKFAEENCSDGLHIDGHFTKWTAKMILADVYLSRAGWYRTSEKGEIVQGDQANWALARDKAKDIIDNSPHSLNTEELNESGTITPAYGRAWDYRAPFTPESMLELSYIQTLGLGSWYTRNSVPFTDGRDYWGGQNDTPLLNTPDSIALTVNQLRFIPSDRANLIRIGHNIPTPDLYNAFEDGDLRRDYSLMTRFDDFNSSQAPRVLLCQPTFRKLVDIDYLLGEPETSFSYTTQNIILYRYADALLIYAEAQNEADGSPNAAAYAALNEIRDRAGLSPLDGLSQDEFRKAVWQERRVELHAEFKRKFDLMRTNRLVQETTDINLDWTEAEGAIPPSNYTSTEPYSYTNAYNAYYNSRTPYPDNEWLWPIPQPQFNLNIKNGWYQNEGY